MMFWDNLRRVGQAASAPTHRGCDGGSAPKRLDPPYFLLLCLWCCGQVAAKPIDFGRDIRPILSDHCLACHGLDESTREAGLRLDLAEEAYDSGAITPGDAEASELWYRIISEDVDSVMPPPHFHKPLSDQQRELLRQWIDDGAKYEDHWAFTAPVKPQLPKADQVALTNPIDSFIAARLVEADLSPSPRADRRTLIRRLSLDLIGLPPTPDQTAEFLADEGVGATDRLIDRLIASVGFGENMARQWLDLARYADTHGLHLDNRRSMWPYRDWVIRALNENLPFDEFTRWQLAGDLLPDPTTDQLVASGFNRCNVTTNEGGSIAEELQFRYAVDRTTTTAEVWMGLTAGCAVCHDHKFDPISAKDFYSLYAFFNSTADPALDGNQTDTPPVLRLYEEAVAAEAAELHEQIDTQETMIREAIDGLKYVDKKGPPTKSFKAWTKKNQSRRIKELSNDLQAVVRGIPPEQWSPEQRAGIFDHWIRNVSVDAKPVLETLTAVKAALVKSIDEINKKTPTTLIMADLPRPRETFVMVRGAYDQPGEEVTPAVPNFLPPISAGSSDESNEPVDRLDLANWLVSGDHPLTARVTVNRLWQHFFGTGLVSTSGDFGSQGEPPSHPELLDWLAVEFVDSGWNVKHMIRLIVSSKTYQQSSVVTQRSLEIDPENRLLSRLPRLRLEAEVMRDQALFLSGLLVPTVGGPGVHPYQPPNIWEPVGFGGSNTLNYVQDHGDALYRRSIYTFLKRTAPPPFMSSFDAPNREQTCMARSRSNTPMQALQLMNDIQHVEAARQLATRILTNQDADGSPVQDAWQLVTGRIAEPDEVKAASEVLTRFRDRYRDDPQSADELIHFGESEVDSELDPIELAAHTMMASVLLNLDETICRN